MWGKEQVTTRKVVGALTMVIGAIIIFSPKTSSLNIGDFIILGATVFAPLGNYFQQKARKKVSSSVLLFMRSIISSIFLFVIASFVYQAPVFSDFLGSWIFLFINGFLFLGLSKIFWVEAIHRIPITKAISLATITPVFTLIFAFFILKEVPSLWQLIGIVPIMLGSLLIVQKEKFRVLFD